MGKSNISIFIPHVGCPHSCSFCNQRTITGMRDIPHGEDAAAVCKQALREVKDTKNAEVAFFGGSFTAVPRDYMLELLSAVQPFIGDGKFKGIRISTRPDYISEEILRILEEYHVTSIELGAQSMCDRVLEMNERGHTCAQAEEAVRLIKNHGGFELGLQMMVGLYGSSPDDEKFTWEKICTLKPDTVRIYPTVILEDTKLGRLYKEGIYKPFDFDTAVDLCADFLLSAEKAGIRVIKLGLHSSTDVEEKMLGGFYHPAFRELCEGRIYRNLFEEHISRVTGAEYAEFIVPPKNLSKALGQKKCNVRYFKSKGVALKIYTDDKIKKRAEVVNIR